MLSSRSFCSLCQKDIGGRRSAAEQAAFDDALAQMQLWYAHPLTSLHFTSHHSPSRATAGPGARGAKWSGRTVRYAHPLTTTAVMADLPDSARGTRPGYLDSGWPTFEFAVSTLGKQASLR